MNQDFNYNPESNAQQTTFTPAEPTSNGKGKAIASLCLGIASVFFTCCCCCLFYISIVLSILSIVFAVLAKNDNGGKMPGLATAGMILAIIGLAFFLCMLVFEIVIGSIPEEKLFEMLDPLFQDAYGMTFEEYMNSMGGIEFETEG